MSLTSLAPILMLVAVAVLFSTPQFRNRKGAKVVAAIAALGAVLVMFYAIGYQSGRDRALRDNRVDARAAAEAAKL